MFCHHLDSGSYCKNVSPHITVLVQEYLAECHVPALHHPPYSTNLSLYDFFVSASVIALKEKHHEDMAESQTSVTHVLNASQIKLFLIVSMASRNIGSCA